MFDNILAALYVLIYGGLLVLSLVVTFTTSVGLWGIAGIAGFTWLTWREVRALKQ